MPAIIHQLALVSQSQQVRTADVMKVSAALQKQVTRDLAPIWEISANVDVFETVEDVPLGYWTMIVMDDIQTQGAAGVHEDRNGQPLALISASSNLNDWSLTASHEALEMLVDPSGNRLVAGDSPKSDQGRVSFLVEVCDPSEAADYAYSVNGVLVSDFYTPHFFDPLKATAVRYSYTGAITEPRQVLPGGYLSWVDPASGSWWQETMFDATVAFRELGHIDQRTGSLRASVDGFASNVTATAIARGRDKSKGAGLDVDIVSRAARARGGLLQQDIEAMLGRPVMRPDARRSATLRSAPSVPSQGTGS